MMKLRWEVAVGLEVGLEVGLGVGLGVGLVPTPVQYSSVWILLRQDRMDMCPGLKIVERVSLLIKRKITTYATIVSCYSNNYNNIIDYTI